MFTLVMGLLVMGPLVAEARAVDLDRYPLVAEVTLPEGEIVRLEVPPSMQAVDSAGEGSDLLLVNGAGEAIPVAWARGRVPADKAYVGVRLTNKDSVYDVDPHGRVIDGLRLELPGKRGAATVTTQRQSKGEWVDYGEPFLVWKLDGDANADLLFEPTADPLRIAVEFHGFRPGGTVGFQGLIRPEPSVPPHIFRLPVSNAGVDESGWIHYEVALPAPLPVDRITLHPTGDVFERTAKVTTEEDYRYQSPWGASATVKRIHIGGTAIDQTTLNAHGLYGDNLVIHLSNDGLGPLELPEVTIEVDGVQLLVRNAGEGPHKLYGGAPTHTTPAWDLQAAAPELARLATTTVRAAEPRANPSYEPPEVRAQLVEPGVELDLTDFQWSHAVAGSGLVRIPLSPEVLTNSRDDLGDLRLVTAAKKQLPYLLESRAQEQWQGLTFTREERGENSILRASLSNPDVPVATVTLRTDAQLFSRRVLIQRARGTHLETLRTHYWYGDSEPSAISLQVDSVVGDELIVTIENDSDAPLPITTLEASWQPMELIAYLPEEEVSLVYGNGRATSPEYDLYGMSAELSHRAVTVATLGPREAMKPTPTSFVDRVVLFAGLAILVLGLLGLTLSLLRRIPESDATPEPAAAEKGAR